MTIVTFHQTYSSSICDELNIIVMRILLSALGLFTFLQVSAQQLATVSAEKAMAMAREGTLIIDVRDPDELVAIAYDAPGVVNIPLGELSERLSEIPKDVPVIIACRSGSRSAEATEQLRTLGYTNTLTLSGGLYAWQEAGLPVKKAESKAACCAGGKADAKECAPGSKAGCCSGGSKAAKPADKKAPKRR